MIKILKRIRDLYQKSLPFKIIEKELQRRFFDALKQIHVESYFLDGIWELIKLFPNPKRVTWYVLTPANYDFLRNLFPLPNELDEIMSARVRWMNEHDYPIGLHVHFYFIGSMSTKSKKEMLARAISWGLKNQITFAKFVPGWFNYTSDLKELCNSFDLQLVPREPAIHDYNLREYKSFLERIP